MKRTSGQDGGVGKLHITTEKIKTRLQNKFHPDSSENQAVWKSDNQGLKEATYIQIGRNLTKVLIWFFRCMPFKCQLFAKPHTLAYVSGKVWKEILFPL